MKDKLKITFTVLAGILVALLIGEVGLRLSGYCKTYTEMRDGNYIPANSYDPKNTYWRMPPHTTQTIRTGEFTITRYTNALGFADREFLPRTDSNEIRILSLGGSFTYGDGAPSDSAYPAILQSILSTRFPDKKIAVYNAGTCGSDPVFGYMAYSHLLKDIVDPDIILQAFHSNDVDEDMVIRGGFERYITDSTMNFDGVQFRWGALYHYSHLARLYFKNVCGYNEFFINNDIRMAALPHEIQTMRQIEKDWNAILKPKQKFFFLLHPDKGEIYYGFYLSHIQTVLDSMATERGHLGIIDFGKWLKENAGNSKPDPDKICWKYDGHYNPSGYRLMALSAADGLSPLIEQMTK